ncbi:LRR receptor-like kinase [Quillaja saponaria]|uniref:non-specific serine/threonine protein kinase n=1 Tax=Quillaja saponaria TaxID=32244 RepID=A0AAD7PBG8_QUISA|nr:LRR receptor-like kinase [Quillaja saponaria]KAJ7948675.1 LRR receptor-like kinase [Quillaja saponaria]
MVEQRCIPMSFLKWVFLACFLCSSLGIETPVQSCHPQDLLALKDFAGNLKNGSIIKAWSKDSVCCKWDGVFCENVNNGTAASRVAKLILSQMGLQGTISHSLAKLDQLNLLNLSFNRLEGELPAEISKLKRLKVLDLSYNMLSGPVSAALSGLESIQILNISSNLLNGDLFQLGEFPHLVVFNISNNSFTGGFSPGICSSSNGIQILDFSVNHFAGGLEGLANCSTSLQQLHFDFNLFSGPIPDSLYSMTALEQLSVSLNNFSGQVSKKLSKLSSLKSLVISGNQFSGELPNVFGNLTQLEQLIVHSNSFSGLLPSTLAFCSKLHLLDVRNNSFRGPVDLDFTRLHNLSTLDLASNHFSGPLPNSMFNCHKLKILSFAKNNFNGPIPENFANLISLSSLSLSNNSFVNLTGALSVLQQCKNLTTLILTKNFHGEEIPNIIGGFESLTILAFGNCGLKGQIPNWLLSCRKLQVLDLSWNHLEGSIPSWIGKMDNLFYLDFSNNSLTGEIPKSLTELRSLIFRNYSTPNFSVSAGMPLYVKRNRSANGLQYNHVSSFPPSIYLSNNRLSGKIWPQIGQLKALHVLDLSRNNITGVIPSSISEMENLETLDLSSNNLYGSIPPSFNKLTFLSKFSVANNHLQGAIPTGGQFLSFPSSSFEGNMGLCRAIDSPCKLVNTMGLRPNSIPSGSDSKFGRSNILGITISVGIGLALLLAVGLLKLSKRDTGNPVDNYNEELGRPRRLSDALGSSKLVLFPNSECKDLTVTDLLKSTNNFNQANIIGCGGFGLVYKANLPNGTKAAVKRLSGDCGQMEREFQAEVEALSRAQHRNLVSLKGYCRHGNDRLLIYSYLENGSLDYWLHETVDGNSVLKWDVRLNIAQGAARGLAYLHKVCEPNIVHRDVKSSNILLDGRFEAHLADFGLSRLLQPYDSHVTTDLVGTLGYIPPEYSQTLTATFRGDVYSFGVVLLELLTCRRPVEVIKGKNCRDLVSWVFQMQAEKREHEIFDSSIWDKDHEKQLLEVLAVACKCIDHEPRRRPSIEEVVSWLDGVGFEGSQQ